MGIHEKLSINVIFVDDVAKVSCDERGAFFLRELTKLVAHISLLVHELLKSVFACSLLSRNSRSNNLKGLVSLESNLVPLKAPDVVHHLDVNDLASLLGMFLLKSQTFSRFGDAKFLADLDIHLLVFLAGCVQLNIVLLKRIHELHQLVE